jgi:hypothetical protein
MNEPQIPEGFPEDIRERIERVFPNPDTQKYVLHLAQFAFHEGELRVMRRWRDEALRTQDALSEAEG